MTARVAVMRMEGTNCEREMHEAFRIAGGAPEFVHLKQIGPHATANRVRLTDYDVLGFPGGFSGGDYVRAGAIFAARLRSAAWKELEAAHADATPVLGVCNGFQILVELGLLPRGGGKVDSCLFNNASGRFECRPTFVAPAPGVCKFTRDLGAPLLFPSAHGEGHLILPQGLPMRQLQERGQIAFQFVSPTGGGAPSYPWNPNGSDLAVAGVTDPTGTILGLMPHPERMIHGWQVRPFVDGAPAEGPGLQLFRNILAGAR